MKHHAARRHKYGAESTTLDGIRFASKAEAKRWAELCLLERAGEITGLERQVPIPLQGQDGPILTPTGRPATYVADFAYVDNRTGEKVYEDRKGVQTPEFKLKRAILAAQGVKVALT
jgi:hypothetical protein